MSTNPVTGGTTPSGGCCTNAPAALVAPLAIVNVAGLAAINYRIGTFSSFRAAMFDAVPLPDLLATWSTTLAANVSPSDSTIAVVDASQFPLAPPFRVKVGSEYVTVIAGAGTNTWTVTRGPGAAAHAIGDPAVLSPANPFASWHPGIAGDYQSMFVELWSYLADILTFYQERVANEAFLQTATQRDSMLRIASLVDYHASPGSGADGLVALTAAKNQSAAVPAGFRVGSRATPGNPAVVFETVAAITASGENSQIPLSAVSPDVEFAANTIVLAGINTGLEVNDYVLATEGQPPFPFFLQLSAVTVDKVAGTTTVNWVTSANGYSQASKQVALFAFRTTAAPFGSGAPAWGSLAPSLTNSDGKNPDAPYDHNWDQPTEYWWPLQNPDGTFVFESRRINDELEVTGMSRPVLGRSPDNGVLTLISPADALYVHLYSEKDPWFYIPMPGDPDASKTLFLDGVYRDLKYSAANPGWAVLLAGDISPQILNVSDARQVSKTGYAMTTKATRLTIDAEISPTLYPLRDTTVLTGTRLLPLQQDLPLPTALSGATLVLAGVHALLQDGQTILLTGPLLSTGVAAAESCVIDGAPAPDSANGVTVVNLKSPLTNTYQRSGCSIMANIVEVTQGETVKDETLGSGDGTPFQAYPLKNKPLTYLPATNPDGLSAVESTLLVTVNGVEWTELANLAGSAPHDQVYIVTTDDTGQSTVSFGDGFHGACPPSGVGNLHARYRKGLGSAGNVASGGVTLLVDSVPNLQKVTNPSGFNGGTDAQSISGIRTQAPSSLQTFGRAVSVADYAALALTYPGIAKASASLVMQDSVSGQPLVHPAIQLTVATTSQSSIQGTPLASKLRQFLDSHRDPNVLLRILDSQPAYIAVTVAIDIDPSYPHQGTINAVAAALNPGLNPDGSAGFFAFERLQFGQPVYLSEVYATVQGVPGVADANITQLRRILPRFFETFPVARLGIITENLRRPVAGFAVVVTPPGDITVGATEIVTIDPLAFPGSELTVSGQGGYADL